MQQTTRGSVEMSAAMAILGTIGAFVVLSGQPALDVVFWRCAFGALTLLVICSGKKLLRRELLSPRVLGLSALGGVAIVVNWLLLFAAYRHASISIATAVYNTQPFILVGLGALLFKERPGLGKLAWLGLAFAGMLMIVQTKSEASYTASGYALGIVMALCAALFWAVAAIIAKKLAGTPPHLIALIQVCVGTVMLAPLAHWSALPSGALAWGSLATIGLVHTGLMYILMYSAVQKLPTHLQGALSFIYPVVAIVVDLLAFGHRLQVLQLVGAATVLLAAAGMSLGWSWRRLTAASPQATRRMG
jgi:drug/metabolite transporter (DMT)-like permease